MHAISQQIYAADLPVNVLLQVVYGDGLLPTARLDVHSLQDVDVKPVKVYFCLAIPDTHTLHC